MTETDEGMAILLSLVLSVRLCSRADQRSPKPFISKEARQSRSGKHFDPYLMMLQMTNDLTALYGSQTRHSKARFFCADIVTDRSISTEIGKHSHIITSPPYINAQDYFRNFKLELYVIENLLPFSMLDLRPRFVGTERGDLLASVPEATLKDNCKRVPALSLMSRRSPRSAAVVHRYLRDMNCAFDLMKKCLLPGGTLVLVCGDNLIAGIRIPTWKILQKMLEERGFELFDSFSDPIEDRLLPPQRSGHKGLIKEEVVCAFRL